MREIRFKKADTVRVIAELASYIDSLNDDKEYILTVKEHKQKRSLNANSYAWTLMDKLAEKLRMAKTEIYRSYIKEIGGNNTLICVQDIALDDLLRNWQSHGVGWLAETEKSKLEGCTTGVSAHDRAATIRALADPTSTPQTFGRPGHVNPLYAQENGVLKRSGHTEAAIDLCKMAGLYPAGALMEIMNEDGTMARMPQLMAFARQHNMKIITIKDMIAYRLKQDSLVEMGEEVDMPTAYGHFRLIPFRQISNGLEHFALIKGEWQEGEPIMVRVHSSCATGDILGSMRCDCGEQLHKAMQMIDKEVQEEGLDTVEANVHLGFKPDERDYGCGAQILAKLGVRKMRLLTNNPVKRVGLEAYGLEIVENVPIEVKPNEYNLRYLKTKKDRMGHILHL